MNKFIFFLLIFFLVNGCESLKKGLGMEKEVPDEFLIKKNSTIKKPPNYDLLPPDSKSKTVNKEQNQNNDKDLINILDKADKDPFLYQLEEIHFMKRSLRRLKEVNQLAKIAQKGGFGYDV